MEQKFRQESDSIGIIQVSSDKYWGAQTQRSLIHFSIGEDIIPIEMIHSMGILKKSAALANFELGLLNKEKMDLIVKASDEIITGKLDDHFPLHVWMTGSGTQSNMNINEVISNRAIELAGGIMGTKNPIHPNDHVNMSQSSNDTFPTGMCITIAKIVLDKLLPALKKITDGFWEKSKEWSDIVKVGRTHMQDAVPLTLGQEFSGYAVNLEEAYKRIEWALKDVYKLAIGGTAVGTGINTHPEFSETAVKNIKKFTNIPFVSAENKFAVQGSHDALVAMSGAIKTLACTLLKISNDIRLLSCGPRTGFHELIIPSNEPGSSIMPGKVNPTQCEAMSMVAMQVIGYDNAVSHAGAGGYLEMNVYKPLILHNIVQSVKIISDSCLNFTKYLLEGTKPNKKKIAYFLDQSLMLVTALSPVIGYDKASKLAHYADDNDCTLREANKKLMYLKEEELEKYLLQAVKF